MKRQFHKTIIIAVFVLILSAGCGKTGAAEGQTGQAGQEGVSRYRVERSLSVEWEKQGEDGAEMYAYSAAWGDTLYVLVSSGLTGTDSRLYTCRMAAGKIEETPFHLEIPGREKPLFVESMTVSGEGELTLRLSEKTEENGVEYFFCRTDLSGKTLDEEALFQAEGEFPPALGRCWTGPEGFALLSAEGEDGTEILRYDLTARKSEKLGSVDGFVRALCPDGEDGLYYIEEDYLWRLAQGKEEAERLASMGETGSLLTYDVHILTDGEGRLAVCCLDAGNAEIYFLKDDEKTASAGGEDSSGTLESSGSMDPLENSGEKEAEYETISIANLHMGNAIVSAAREWSAKSGRYRIHGESETYGTAQWSTLRTRTMTDLTAGQGPELLVVSASDLRTLAEKGALMDLSELVPEDIQEQIFPGVRELGTVDGVWLGLGWNPTVNVVFTSDELWEGDSWTVSDILELAEEKEGLEWIFGYRDLTAGENTSSAPDGRSVFDSLIIYSLGDSPFLDLENGRSFFDGEEFINVLEFCKRYGQSASGSRTGEEKDAMLREGRMLAMRSSLFEGFYSYSNMAVRLPGCHLAGETAEKGSGRYISSDNYLVVNADAENIDAIKDCIAYLYSYDSQMMISTVRRDVAKDQLVYDSGMERVVLKIKGSQMIPDMSPDGGVSYREDYLAYLESLEPEPYCPREIKNIVTEVSDSFFAGNRSAQEAAELIQRRVQLYFDEQE